LLLGWHWTLIVATYGWLWWSLSRLSWGGVVTLMVVISTTTTTDIGIRCRCRWCSSVGITDWRRCVIRVIVIRRLLLLRMLRISIIITSRIVFPNIFAANWSRSYSNIGINRWRCRGHHRMMMLLGVLHLLTAEARSRIAIHVNRLLRWCTGRMGSHIARQHGSWIMTFLLHCQVILQFQMTSCRRPMRNRG
jgi:hypothetical protein